jgi:hypothetical protein
MPVSVAILWYGATAWLCVSIQFNPARISAPSLVLWEKSEVKFQIFNIRF